MTSGVYSLYWEKEALVYVGLSQNINNRFLTHLRDLRSNSHTNYKVQDAYNNLGPPTLVILEVCKVSELNSKEIVWTNEFSSITEGLNIVSAGQVGFGTDSSNSKYSKSKILKVFSMLYRTSTPSKDIASRLGVNHSLVSSIYTGDTHLWLRDTYTEKYAKMLIMNKVRWQNRLLPDNRFRVNSKQLILKIFSLLYKTQKTHKEISNRLGVPVPTIGAISSGTNHSWLQKTYPAQYQKMSVNNQKRLEAATNTGKVFSLISPIGNIYTDIINAREFCRSIKEFSDNVLVSSKGLSKLRSGDRVSYRGWKIYKKEV